MPAAAPPHLWHSGRGVHIKHLGLTLLTCDQHLGGQTGSLSSPLPSSPVVSTSSAVYTSSRGQASGCRRMCAWNSSVAAASSSCACCRATSSTCASVRMQVCVNVCLSARVDMDVRVYVRVRVNVCVRVCAHHHAPWLQHGACVAAC